MQKIKITKDEKWPDFHFKFLPTNDARFSHEKAVNVPDHKIAKWKRAQQLYEDAQSEMKAYYQQSLNDEETETDN